MRSLPTLVGAQTPDMKDPVLRRYLELDVIDEQRTPTASRGFEGE